MYSWDLTFVRFPAQYIGWYVRGWTSLIHQEIILIHELFAQTKISNGHFQGMLMQDEITQFQVTMNNIPLEWIKPRD